MEKKTQHLREVLRHYTSTCMDPSYRKATWTFQKKQLCSLPWIARAEVLCWLGRVVDRALEF